MIRRSASAFSVAAIGVALLVSWEAPAVATVDPRYSYAVEANFSVGSFSSLGTTGGRTQLYLGGGVAFLAPVSENRQISFGLRGGTGSDSGGSVRFGTFSVGYRMLSEFDKLETRLDLGLGADLSRVSVTAQPPPSAVFSLGALFGFGALYQFATGWRAGLELGGGFYVIHLRAQFQATPVVTFSW